MNKLHVLTNKSELKKEQLQDKIVIVLDILIGDFYSSYEWSD